MSTGLIVAIVVVAIIIIALLVLLPRMRETARRKKAERELHSRRQAVAGEHREAAAQRETRAEEAERKARMAEQAAQRERAEANMSQERAAMHERGMADDELIDDHERDRFADVAGPDPSADADRDGHTADDRARGAATPAATDRDTDTAPAPTDRDHVAATPDAPPASEGSQSPDYQRGREDEKRLERDRLTEDVRESDRSRTN
jgi:type II secretory pathway pseudopilin PulG